MNRFREYQSKGESGLLIWAYRKPLKRRFVALLTVQVILGMIAAELSMVSSLKLSKLIPTFLLQAFLLALFSYAYVASRDVPEGRML